MNFFEQLFSASTGTLIDKISNAIDKFHLSGEEKQKFKLQFEALLQRRDTEVEQTLRSRLQAQEKILVAELTQGDSYTKRARPTVVYAGLVFIFINYILVPALGKMSGGDVQPMELPAEFWYGWSGIVATWSVGRSFEKSRASNSVTRMITGNPKTPSLFDDANDIKG